MRTGNIFKRGSPFDWVPGVVACPYESTPEAEILPVV
jgi:hypothetical protein